MCQMLCFIGALVYKDAHLSLVVCLTPDRSWNIFTACKHLHKLNPCMFHHLTCAVTSYRVFFCLG